MPSPSIADPPPRHSDGGWLRSRDVRRLLGVGHSTLSAWARRGVLPTVRLPTIGHGRRKHRLYDVRGLLSPSTTPAGEAPPSRHHPGVATPTEAPPPRVDAVYGRVSTRKQQPDLDRQIQALRARHPEATLSFRDIASGVNFRRSGLQRLLGRVLDGGIRTVYVAHRDRLCRIAYDLLEFVCNHCGTNLVVDAHDPTATGRDDDNTAELADGRVPAVTKPKTIEV